MAVECGEAVVGHPLTVSAVIRARREVQIGGVAVAFADKWLLARPWYTSGFERGEQLWGTVTLVSAEAPVAMSAGGERRWSAETGVARFPTKPALGRSSIEYDHSVEMAVSPVGHLLPTARVETRVGGFPALGERRSRRVRRAPRRASVGLRESRRCHAGWHGGPGHQARGRRDGRVGPRGALAPHDTRRQAPEQTQALRADDRTGRRGRHPGDPRRRVADHAPLPGRGAVVRRVSAGGGVAEVELNVFNAT